MVSRPNDLRRQLREAGIANAAIDAAWPQWWSEEAEGSLSATAELTYTVARRLGLSARSLMSGEPVFIWRDEARFKGLSADDQRAQAALTSFAVSLTGLLHTAVLAEVPHPAPSADQLRQAIMRRNRWVDTESLVAAAWGFGIPLLQLRVFPLEHKAMHAMTARAGGGFGIFIGKEMSYVSALAFTIAHEMGHIFLGHLAEDRSHVDNVDPVSVPGQDRTPRELEADAFALALLTGSERPDVSTDSATFTASQLAEACRSRGPTLGIEPGVLALCLAYGTGKWEQAYGALKIMQDGQMDVGGWINQVARAQLRLSFEDLDGENYQYLERIIDAGSKR